MHDHVGDARYQRTALRPGAGPASGCPSTDAACHRPWFRFDDEQVAEHEGGYLPFEVDRHCAVRRGGEHRLTVAVNNELSRQSILPGMTVTTRTAESRRSTTTPTSSTTAAWALQRLLCSTPPAHLRRLLRSPATWRLLAWSARCGQRRRRDRRPAACARR